MSRVERSGPSPRARLTSLSQQARASLGNAIRVSELEAPSPLEVDSGLFNLERLAWSVSSMAEVLIFELRLSPGSTLQPSKMIDVLVREASLPLGDGRRVKQVLEYRTLSQRDPQWVNATQILSADTLGFVREVLEIWLEFSVKAIPSQCD